MPQCGQEEEKKYSIFTVYGHVPGQEPAIHRVIKLTVFVDPSLVIITL